MLNNSPIVIYGAGMIGQVVMPFIIQELGVIDRLVFYVDSDVTKQGDTIKVGGKDVEIKSPEVLQKLPSNAVILISNSNYSAIVSMMDSIEELRENVGVIIPAILAEKAKEFKKNFNSKKISEKEHSNSIELKIPKKIHYCWFSKSQMPSYLEKCIESWTRFNPEYEIIRWDEDNYDVEKNLYMKQAYEAKKWGFVPDIARLDILYNYGGIYIDTDVEVVRNLDDLLVYEAFTGVEKWGSVNRGGCSGAVPHHPMIKKILDFRLNERFIREDGTMNLTTCGYYETIPFVNMGYIPNNTVQTIGGMTLLTSDYFHPYDYMSGETIITDNTYSIHHFNGGWLDENYRAERERTKEEHQKILRRISENMYDD